MMSEKGEVRDFYPVTQRHNNNNKELTQHFQNLKALYNLKKTNKHTMHKYPYLYNCRYKLAFSYNCNLFKHFFPFMYMS